MQKVFEFGEYWDFNTYLLIMIVGVAICYFHYRGVLLDNKRRNLTISIGNRKKVNLNIWFFLMFLLFLFLYTFKSWTYGADGEYYYEAFKLSTSFHNELNVTWEPLFLLFNYTIRHVTDNYTIYCFFAGLVISFGYVHFIHEFWTTKEDSLFLILISTEFFYDMNIMRSGIGGAFLLLSLCYLKKSNIKKAFLFSIIALLFHYTLIVHLVFLIFYCLVSRHNGINSRFSRTRVFSYEIIAFVGSFGASYLLRKMLVGTRYEWYFDAMTPTVIGSWSIIMSSILAVIALYRKRYDNCVGISIISSLYSILLIPPVVILGAYRLTQYHFSVRLLLWGWVFKDILKNEELNNLIKTVVILSMIVFYSVFYLGRRSLNPGFVYELVNIF